MKPLCPLAAALAVLIGLSVIPALADSDHDRARRALEAGRILPLKDILSRVEAEHPGRLLEAELEDDDDGPLVYEIKLLDPDGRVVKLYVDAATGTVLKKSLRGDGRGDGRRERHQ